MAREAASLTRGLKPSEAVWLRQHPLLVGLISLLIGSSDQREIETCAAALIERGKRIQDGTLFDESQESPKNQWLS